MKEILISILRDKNTGSAEFRSATEKLGSLLALEAATYLPKKTTVIETPLCKAEGYRFFKPVVLIPILRAGLALLYPFIRFFPEARVGFVGIRRDEITAEPHVYYHNLPHFESTDDILILEPMVATGGSGSATVTMLLERGVRQEQILVLGIVAAPEGLQRLKQKFPRIKIHVLQTDEALNDRKFIVPGLGDFGDRYFGTGQEGQ